VGGIAPGPAAASAPQLSAPTSHRVRSVLAIPAFRRLWLVTAVSSTGDWLSLLALSALATQLTTGYQAQSFALGGVVATKLLPALVLGPLAGALADKFDRRRVMVVCDVFRFVLFLSIPLVGSLWWLFVATFLIEICALFWIPAKDASVPNLLRRPDQVETANQLALVMTYGVAVITASGLFTVISSTGALLPGETTQVSTAYVALVLNGLAYLLTATTVWFRIKEISGRAAQRRQEAPGLVGLLRDGARFVVSTPLIRGLVTGIVGAFSAGGIVVGSATLYAASLGGGNAAYGTLFVCVFIGLALGMGAAPRLARRMPHNRLFGAAIVTAGLALVLVAVAPHLFFALAAVGLVGGFAGIAFLTGLTIIGTQVADEIRGRIIAFVQSIVRLTLLGSMALVPLLVGLVRARTVEVLGYPFLVDGTRVVMLAGGLVAAGVGLLAYRQMDDRRLEPLLPDLLAALRRDDRRPGSGLLIAVEGATPGETATQSARLVARLRAAGHTVVEPEDGADDVARWAAATREARLSGARARALAAAAVRADMVERVVRPALAAGAIVVVDQFLASPLAQFGVAADRAHTELDPGELESLAAWATGRLRPDVSVLLDRAPPLDAAAAMGAVATPPAAAAQPMPGEEHVRVQRLLTRMAAAEPHRYAVIDADGSPDEVAERVFAGLAPMLPAPARPEGSTVPTPRWAPGRRGGAPRHRAVAESSRPPVDGVGPAGAPGNGVSSAPLPAGPEPDGPVPGDRMPGDGVRGNGAQPATGPGVDGSGATGAQGATGRSARSAEVER
jgi:dTMP kinase